MPPAVAFVLDQENRTSDDQDQLRIQWLNAIRSHSPAPSPVELAAKVMVAVDLATRSIWEGSAFGFDPATMRTRKL